ncbi:hypothetical protein TetV_307 [Tetraselmis virus 1]|uniref:Uncharacterized protein n=1 Tax=Tetraselmis virus 1 TaxID=2060617 RepID=A0A2P0VNS3_9VIRU|nr:hypothetical protein QJ968_gp307 [Tetraselmis virus 1]AUF82399.1 hypothetical protein TetV_307 [Tetraselmis virus 1]
MISWLISFFSSVPPDDEIEKLRIEIARRRRPITYTEFEGKLNVLQKEMKEEILRMQQELSAMRRIVCDELLKPNGGLKRITSNPENVILNDIIDNEKHVNCDCSDVTDSSTNSWHRVKDSDEEKVISI